MATQEQTNTKLLYDVKSAAQAVNLSRSFLFEQIAEGKLPSLKIASRRLIRAEDLFAWIENYRTHSNNGVAA